MSKSEKTSKGTIYLNDDPEVAYKKIMKSVTDSENKVYISNDKPGILNLLNIYAALTNITLVEAEAQFKDSNYVEFKTAVATVVKNELIKIQAKYEEAYKIVDSVTKSGAQKAKEICAPITKKILSKFGFK